MAVARPMPVAAPRRSPTAAPVPEPRRRGEAMSELQRWTDLALSPLKAAGEALADFPALLTNERRRIAVHRGTHEPGVFGIIRPVFRDIRVGCHQKAES